MPVILVGNKIDLEQSGQRRVSPDEGKTLANKFGCRFVETSAAHRRHVDDVFHTLIREIRKQHVGCTPLDRHVPLTIMKMINETN